MIPALHIVRSGPGVTVQDLGRTGYLAQGLSRGGAADRHALAEGAALLQQSPALAALEITGSGIEIETDAPLWIALTGAPMQAVCGDRRLAWNASHLIGPQERLRLGPVLEGNFSYLHVAGGLDVPAHVGARATHLAADLGAAIAPGARLPVGPDDRAGRVAHVLPPADRFAGGEVRLLPGPQTALFPAEVVDRFLTTVFERTAWGNRQGVKLGFDGEGFRPAEGLNLMSEVITPGDVQITGDGTPYVLGAECQTIGGYPRIGTVLPQDLPRVMQASAGSALRFRMVSVEEALHDHLPVEARARALFTLAEPLVRDPHQMADLLSYQLVGGVTAGRELSEEEPER